MRYKFIDRQKGAYPIVVLCRVMRVCRSGYYSWRRHGKSSHRQRNESLLSLVREIHRISGSSYGARRISKKLQGHGFKCGRVRSRTLMKLAGITAKGRRKFKVTTNSKHNLPVAENLLNRQFEVTQPDRVWGSDITYIWTRQGWIYLAVVLDLFSRRVVGWAMSNRITRHLVMDALNMAFYRRHPASGLIFHSDRGSQYCSNDFQMMLKRNGMICSMSRKGNCWDNAPLESFFGTLKTERIFNSNYKTRDQARNDIVDYIEMFYNCQRLHSYLGYLSPMDFEKMRTLKKSA